MKVYLVNIKSIYKILWNFSQICGGFHSQSINSLVGGALGSEPYDIQCQELVYKQHMQDRLASVWKLYSYFSSTVNILR